MRTTTKGESIKLLNGVLGAVKAGGMTVWDYVKLFFWNSFLGGKAVGQSGIDAGGLVLGSASSTGREMGDSSFTAAGQSLRDFGQYSFETAKSVAGTGKVAGGNGLTAAHELGIKAMDGAEVLIKGGAGMCTSAVDSFLPAFHLGRNAKAKGAAGGGDKPAGGAQINTVVKAKPVIKVIPAPKPAKAVAPKPQ